MTAEELLCAGMEAARQRNREEASRLLVKAVQADPNLEAGWLWLGFCRARAEEQAYCFRRVLAINPNNAEAQKRLAKINALPVVVPAHSPTLTPRADAPFQKAAPAPPTAARERPKTDLRWLWGSLFGLIVCAAFMVIEGLSIAKQQGLLSLAAETTKTPTQTLTPTSVPPTAAPTQVYVATFEASECPFNLPQGSVVTCGFVTVPEDRTGDVSDTIQLAVAVYRSSNPNPAPDPIIYISGGPGGEALHWTASVYSTFIAPLTNERDFIVFDQRGIGSSKPELECDLLNRTYTKSRLDKLPEGEDLHYYQGAAATCHDLFTGQGINPKQYNSAASAADTKDIIRALGYTQANLYGISYGTRIAQIIMRDYPEAVRSVILDSVVPADINLFEGIDISSEDHATHIISECASDPDCASAYPNLQQTYDELVQRFSQNPITLRLANTSWISGTQQVDGEKFADLIAEAGKYASTLSSVPQAISRAAVGDFSSMETMLTPPTVDYHTSSLGVRFLFYCHEHVYASTPQKLGQDWFDFCDLLDSGSIAPGEKDPVQTDIPILIIAGNLDPTTPPNLSDHVRQGFSRSYLVTFKSQAHAPSVYDTSGCAQTIIQSFLRDLSQEPDVTCLRESDEIHFVLPYTGNSPVALEPAYPPGSSFRAMIPVGWKRPWRYDYYARNQSPFDWTKIEIQSLTLSETDWLNVLMTGLMPFGLDAYPPQFEIYKSANFTWHLYAASSYGLPVDIAFATYEEYTIMVVMTTHQDEHKALFTTVFLPVLDSVEP